MMIVTGKKRFHISNPVNVEGFQPGQRKRGAGAVIVYGRALTFRFQRRLADPNSLITAHIVFERLERGGAGLEAMDFEVLAGRFSLRDPRITRDTRWPPMMV